MGLSQQTLVKKGFGYEYHLIKSQNIYKHILKIERDKIDNFDLEIGKQPVETLDSIYNRTKADIIINGGFYDMNSGKSIAHAYDEGKLSGDQWLYNGWSIAKDLQDNILIKQLYNIDRKNYKFILESSPLLVRNGKIDIDDKGLNKSLITSKHPRSAVGINDKYLFFVCIDGRQSFSKGATINELAHTMLGIGCYHALNLDGGGSSRLLLNGKAINNPTENRAVDNALCVYLKKEIKGDKKMPLIGVDIGHGGKDPGAIGKNGLNEKDVTLSVGRKVIDSLKRCGFDVFATRTTDVYLSLKERVDMLNKAKVDLVTSIHVNSTDKPEPNYVANFIVARGGRAEKAAKVIQEELVKATGWSKPDSPDGVIVSSNLYIVKKTDAPAVISELGFISNPTQEKQLSDTSFHEVLAEAIVKGICKHFDVSYVEKQKALYKVQVGAFSIENNAKKLAEELKSKGYPVVIVKE